MTGMTIIKAIQINDSALIASNVAEDDYPAFVIDRVPPYILKERVIVVAANVHKVFESLQDANSGHDPMLDNQKSPVWWLEVSATNRWKMLDEYISSQTENVGTIEVELYAEPVIGALSIQNMEASTLHLTMTAPVDGIVFEDTVDLVSDSGIDDYYEYWFSPVQRLTTYNFLELPLYSESSIKIELENGSGLVKCGAVVLGLPQDIGMTLYGLELSRTDYSSVATDDFGNTGVTKRGNTRNIAMTVRINNDELASVDKLLSEYLSVPAVYVGTDIYQEATTLYGIYQDYSITVQYVSESLVNIRLRGFI
ncbi:MAG: hypothetical protein ACAH12_03610 [Methylophilaceae bacterium]